MYVSRVALPLLVCLLAPCAGMGTGTWERFEYRQMHMGVETRIVLYAPDTGTAVAAARHAFDRIAVLDSIMSDYRADSEVNRLISAAGGPPVPISDELFHVLTRAQALARISDGAFDVTAAPLVQLWRSARRSGVVPADTAISAAARLVGWRHLVLDPENRTAQLARPGMQIDLGGIGKGYASDEALATLRSHGIDRALVQMGGDIVVGESPPGEDGWHIQAGGGQEIELREAALSTSGDTEQFVEIDGVRYSHILDPGTGVGLRSRVEVTVLARDGMTADGLSTLLSVLGAERAEGFVAEHFPEVRVWVRLPDGHPSSDGQ